MRNGNLPLPVDAKASHTAAGEARDAPLRGPGEGVAYVQTHEHPHPARWRASRLSRKRERGTVNFVRNLAP